MYYRLDVQLAPGAGFMQEQENVDQVLMDGQTIDESTLVLPWPYEFRPDAENPVELADYYSGSNLMSQRLVDTIQSCGVDNLQIFSATITNASSGETIPGYVVVNVVGLITAADLAASATRPLADVKYFEKLAIDPSKARDVLMFRLADSRIDVIVAEKVARTIEKGAFVGVVVEPLP